MENTDLTGKCYKAYGMIFRVSDCVEGEYFLQIYWKNFNSIHKDSLKVSKLPDDAKEIPVALFSQVANAYNNIDNFIRNGNQQL